MTLAGKRLLPPNTIDWMEERASTILYLILAVSIFVRIIAAILFNADVKDLPGAADQLSYHTLALRLLGGHGFTFGEPWWPATRAGEPTAHWSYLYSFFIAGVYKLLGPHPVAVRLIQAFIVGLLHPYLAFRIGEKVFNRVTGLIAAGLTSLYAYFVYYSALLMTEAFYITALLGVLLVCITMFGVGDLVLERGKRQVLVAGLWLGFCLSTAILLRQLFLVVVPFIYLWCWWVSRRQAAGRQRILPLFFGGLIVILAIMPFTISNRLRFHQFELLNSNAGFAFFWGNHPIHGDRFQPILTGESGNYGELIPRELIGLDEVSLDKALLKRGIGFVAGDPIRYLKLSISRIPAYFMFWPASGSSPMSNVMRVASFGILFPVMLLGIILAWRQKPNVGATLGSPTGLLLIFVGVYTGIHLLSWALIRYRLPVDAVLIMFAAFALQWLLKKLSFTGEIATNPSVEQSVAHR